MGSYEQMWSLAKWRFLQGEASVWILSNKLVEISLIVGVLTWVYFEFFSFGIYEKIKYLGLIITILSYSEIRSRLKLYEGYFDGYERGFEDAATQNCDYWGDTHDEFSDNTAINSVLDGIKKAEEKTSDKNKKSRREEVEKGLSRLTGYFFTWRKIN